MTRRMGPFLLLGASTDPKGDLFLAALRAENDDRCSIFAMVRPGRRKKLVFFVAWVGKWYARGSVYFCWFFASFVLVERGAAGAPLGRIWVRTLVMVALEVADARISLLPRGYVFILIGSRQFAVYEQIWSAWLGTGRIRTKGNLGKDCSDVGRFDTAVSNNVGFPWMMGHLLLSMLGRKTGESSGSGASGYAGEDIKERLHCYKYGFQPNQIRKG